MKIDKRELLRKLQNNPSENIYETIIKYCKQNVNFIDWGFENKEDKVLITSASSYLMKYKIGKWDPKDAIFMAYYFANNVAKKFGIIYNVDIKLIAENDFTKKYGDGIDGVCIYNSDDTCTIIYHPNLVTQLMGSTSHEFINAIQYIAYQIIIAYQNILIHDNGSITPYNREQYIMALEDVAKSTSEDFYEENYVNLYKENEAELQAINYVEYILKQFKKDNILEKNKKYITQKKENYKKNKYSLKRKQDKETIMPISYTELNARMSLHLIPELLEQYPVLQIAFNKYGHKKGIAVLLKERKQMLKKVNRKIVDNLYSCILTETLINGESSKVNKELSGLPKQLIGETIQKEQTILKQYISQENDDDEFAKEILALLIQKQDTEDSKNKSYAKILDQKKNILDAQNATKNKKTNKQNSISNSELERQQTFEQSKNSITENRNDSKEDILRKSNSTNKKSSKKGVVKIGKKSQQQSNAIKKDKIKRKDEKQKTKNSKQLNLYNNVYEIPQDDLDKEEYNILIQKLEEARRKGYVTAQKKISAKIKERSGYVNYLSSDFNNQPINPYCKDFVDKNEFEKHMKKVEIAKRNRDKVALKELSSQMKQRSGYGSYTSVNFDSNQINPYFKDYLDKKEFDTHMKKVEEAKKYGNKKILMELSSEMMERSGYGIYLSDTPKVQPINLYFKNYIDQIEENNVNRQYRKKEF